MNIKTISIIIPTYNSQETIASCLDSVICQEYKNFEICVVDYNSSDDTVKIVQEYSAKFDFIKLTSEKRQGVYHAMNKGIDISRGEWLLFLGSDDLVYSKNTFKNIFSAPIPKDIGLLYGNVLVMNEAGFARAGQVYDGKFSMDKLLQQNICQQAVFYRRTLFERLGKYNPRYPVCADWEMNMKFFARTKGLYLDLIVARFRGGGLSSMDNYFRDPIYKDIHFLRKKYSGRTYYLAWINDYIKRILYYTSHPGRIFAYITSVVLHLYKSGGTILIPLTFKKKRAGRGKKEK